MIVKYATVTGNYSKSAVVSENSLQISLKIYIGTTLEQITTIHELLTVQVELFQSATTRKVSLQ